MSITYRFRNGFQPRGVLADIAAAELARIHCEHGSIQAAIVVDESRKESAPLHPVFEWNDYTAAEHYRQHQARNLIRSVRVVYGEAEQPAYAHVRVLPQYLPADKSSPAPEQSEEESTKLGGYLPVREIARDDRLVKQAMGSMVAHLKAAERAADELGAALGDARAAAWKVGIRRIIDDAQGDRPAA